MPAWIAVLMRAWCLTGLCALFMLQHAAGPFMRALSGNSTELETLHAQVHELQQAVHELQVSFAGSVLLPA